MKKYRVTLVIPSNILYIEWFNLILVEFGCVVAFKDFCPTKLGFLIPKLEELEDLFHR